MIIITVLAGAKACCPEIVDISNAYRKKHGSPPLVYDRNMSVYAQEWADRMASSGVFMHRPGGVYGENLAWSSGKRWNASKAVVVWYNEGKSYSYSKNTHQPGTGHFSQLIWKASRRVGVGVARSGLGTFVVCNYAPAGNVIGYYKGNVSAPVA